MPALNDRSFNPTAWARLALVAVGLAGLAGIVYASIVVYQQKVENPRLLADRFADAPGTPGIATVKVVHLGAEAVPTLMGDLHGGSNDERRKATELLAQIEDPRVVPALIDALKDRDLGVQLGALAGISRTKAPEAVAAVWQLLERPDEFFRFKAIVVLGVIGEQADAEKLLQLVPKNHGHEQLLLAWAAGRIARKIERRKVDPSGFLPAATVAPDDVEEQKIQDEIEQLRGKIVAGVDLANASTRLDQLTDVGFATWDAAKQIAMQVQWVNGPLSMRAAAGADELRAPKASQRTLELKPR